MERKKLTPFAHEIRVIRLQRDMSLKDFAILMGYTPSYVSAVEKGHKPLRQEFVEKTFKALGIKGDARKQLQDRADMTMVFAFDLSRCREDTRHDLAKLLRLINQIIANDPSEKELGRVLKAIG